MQGETAIKRDISVLRNDVSVSVTNCLYRRWLSEGPVHTENIGNQTLALPESQFVRHEICVKKPIFAQI